MKKAIATILIVVFSVFLFTACQKAAGSEIIVGKGDVMLEQTIDAETAEQPAAYTVPEHWNDTLSQDNLTVTVDAEVVVPDAEQFPVLVLAEDEISQETADKAIETFLQGATLYKQRPDGPCTKEEIAQEIENLQQALTDPNSDMNSVLAPDSQEYKDLAEEKEQEIEAWEKLYETAPEEEELIPASTVFEDILPPENIAPMAIDDSMSEEQKQQIEADNKDKQDHPEKYVRTEINGVALLPDGRMAQLTILKNHLSFYTTELDTVELPVAKEDTPTIPCGITQQQAEKMARQVIADVGIDYMDVAAQETRYILARDEANEFKVASRSECYSFYFMRTANGITENYSVHASPSYPNTSALPYEVAQVVINESGVVQFNWVIPMKALETKSDNVSLLDFSEIQEIFEKHIVMDNTSQYDPWPILSRRIVIEEARLGMMRVSRQGEEGEYLMIPVWDFYGNAATVYEEDDERPISDMLPLNENGEYVAHLTGNSFLTINAIDGSIVNRVSGY